MDAEGKQLTPEGWNELAGLFLNRPQWQPDKEVVVVKDDYVVRGPTRQGNLAWFNVDYLGWGQIDSSLRFTRWEERVPDNPVRIRESYQLALTDKYEELGSEGRVARGETGHLEWRIELYPRAPHATVEAAIRYVREARNKAGDPEVKKNANRTIAALSRLGKLPLTQREGTPRESPWTVLQGFCEMDAAGQALSPDAWKRMAALFVRPGVARRDKVIVVKGFGVSYAARTEENKAEFFVQYLYLGELDSRSAVFGQASTPAYTKVRILYNLVLTDKRWELGANGVTAKEVQGPLAWRIEGFPLEPHITVDTAIRYVTELRDKASDLRIRRNADRAIAALKRLR